MKTGIQLITEERQRQIEVEGYSKEQDLGYKIDELAMAAASYAIPERQRDYPKSTDNRIELKNQAPIGFPWDKHHWKPTPDNRIRELQKAGALIAAEIDRLIVLGTKK